MCLLLYVAAWPVCNPDRSACLGIYLIFPTVRIQLVIKAKVSFSCWDGYVPGGLGADAGGAYESMRRLKKGSLLGRLALAVGRTASIKCMA